ncbi:hypothetical protein J6590_047699 [Homalodisca vitripennis]|nr:hypothetical protein J6590_047699 [Homalodisca vitripennis]
MDGLAQVPPYLCGGGRGRGGLSAIKGAVVAAESPSIRTDGVWLISRSVHGRNTLIRGLKIQGGERARSVGNGLKVTAGLLTVRQGLAGYHCLDRHRTDLSHGHTGSLASPISKRRISRRQYIAAWRFSRMSPTAIYCRLALFRHDLWRQYIAAWPGKG